MYRGLGGKRGKEAGRKKTVDKTSMEIGKEGWRDGGGEVY